MKILIAGFIHETANFSPIPEDVMACHEKERLRPFFDGALQVFEAAGAQVVPSLFFTTDMGAGGTLDYTAFTACADRIIADAAAQEGLDGIFLRLHGASDVEDIGQGELYVLRGIRRAVGYGVPIAVAMDPHGNLSPDITRYANIIRAYHTAPHRDIPETCRVAAQCLLHSVESGQPVRPQLVRVPMLLSGDMAVTDIEPARSIMAMVEEIEALPEVYCASFFISFAFADTDNIYPCAVVVPSAPEHSGAAAAHAARIAEAVYARRREFRFDGIDTSPQEAVELACTLKAPVILSDSGDNPTGGGAGVNTCLMRRFIERGNANGRRVLFSTVYDPVACGMLLRYEAGDEVDFMLGLGLDEDSRPLRIRGTVQARGRAIKGAINNRASTDYGNSVLVTFGDYAVSVTDIRDSMMYDIQFKAAGYRMEDYDVVVVKQAYQFVDIAAYGKSHILARTPGATLQDLKATPYTKVPKTIFPFVD